MKKLMTLLVGLTLALGTVALAQDTMKKDDSTATKKGKGKGKGTTKKDTTKTDKTGTTR
jgi:pentapeptide MXKDX repeat protein